MSMKGDLPGLSNFCAGTMGSYQYSTSRSAEAAAAGSVAAADGPAVAAGAVRHCERP